MSIWISGRLFTSNKRFIKRTLRERIGPLVCRIASPQARMEFTSWETSVIYDTKSSITY